MGLDDLKHFILNLFNKQEKDNKNSNIINDKAFRPIDDLLPLLVNGTLPGINEVSNHSMTAYQKEVMYNNIAKRSTFLKLRQNDQIAHNSTTDEFAADDFMLVISGTFKLINYKYYNKREEKYIDHTTSKTGKSIKLICPFYGLGGPKHLIIS